VQTYNAAGLLNTIMQAGATSAASTTSTDASGTSDSSTSDTSNASSATQSVALNSNWATVLKSNPSYAASMINYATEQGIVSTLSVQA
jgi:hypothetical protein